VGRDGQYPADLSVIEHARHPSRGPAPAWRDTVARRLWPAAADSGPPAAGQSQVSYSSGTRVGVARVRVSFLKYAGAVSRM
jgi:hypothetical protein